MNLENFTIPEARKGLKNKEFSAGELVSEYLSRINAQDPKIGAYLSIMKEDARERAKKVDRSISEGKDIENLGGIPAAIKDNILIEGFPTTAASKILENYTAVFNATVIKKLKENQSIFLGKANLDEFAMGTSNENSAFREVRNPKDLDRVPGGSSGGPAAAVANNECIYSIGSDTGGSLRQPASFCGVVGLKPTYGTVSRCGLIAFASSLDQIGPITKTVEDAELVYKVIRGKDKNDSTTVEIEEEGSSKSAKQLTVGIPKEFFGEGIEKQIKERVEEIIKKLEKEGIQTKQVSIPRQKYALAVYYIVANAEASSNLARYDGIKYGASEMGNQNVESLRDIYFNTRGRNFGPEVKRRIMLGTYGLSAGYHDAFYLKAQKVRTLLKKDFDEAFEKADLLISPTAPHLPFKIGEKIEDPLQMYMSDMLTVPANLAGLPAMSVPVEKKDSLPIGLQIIGNQFKEPQIFEMGKFIEKIK